MNGKAARVAVAAGLAAIAAGLSCQEVTGPGDVVPTPAFITVRRPWTAAERDSVVARMRRDSGDAFYYPAAVASLLAGSDSVTVVVPNPQFAAGAAPVPGLRRSPLLGQAGQTWILIGLDLREVFPITPGSSTLDSLNWVGVLWFASPESTWKGRMMVASVAPTTAKTAVNTAAFDSSGGKSGAGGGEARASTGHYWEGNSGFIWIRGNVCSPSSCAEASFTSGPWTGGTWHGILVNGNLMTIVAPCVLPAGCTAPPDTFNVGFNGQPVTGLAITCIFPSPCTGAAGVSVARAMRERRAAALRAAAAR